MSKPTAPKPDPKPCRATDKRTVPFRPCELPEGHAGKHQWTTPDTWPAGHQGKKVLF